MTEKIKNMLAKVERGGVHDALLNVLQEPLKRSRAIMQQNHYAAWDSQHEAYMSRRVADKSDKEANAQGLPTKTTVPIVTSQVNTFVAFAYMLLTQRERFFEFPAVESADGGLRECVEKLVQRDIDFSNGKTMLVQSLLDLAIRGIFVQKDWWEKKTVWLPVQRTTEASYNGVSSGTQIVEEVVEQFTQREGNLLRNISPYRFFPDPSMHISEWTKGSFAAVDEEYSRHALKQLESMGVVAGVDHIKDYTVEQLKTYNREKSVLLGINKKEPGKEGSTIVITEVIMDIVPSSIKGGNGQVLDKSPNLEKWLVWVANDNQIIRAERYGAYHCMFPLAVGLFMPDMHESALQSVATASQDMQRLISWLLNSRMAAVSRTVDNQMVADPLGIEVGDIAARARVIRLTKFAAGKDVNRFIKQIQHVDTTTGHVSDMSSLMELLERVTGINNNAMGQYNGGRRSATEARNVTNGAAARMKLVISQVWESAFQGQGNRMLINHRQYTSQDEFISVCGQEKAQYFEQFRSNPAQLVKSYDFITFDGTLSSEKMFLAQQLQEVLTLLLSNPMSAMSFGLSANAMLKRVMELRGAGTLNDFALTPEEAQRLMAMAQPAAPAGPAQ